ncbi:MAG: 2-amino-4-hydroxy-6-hydroxymethyldihydropteridine diphosphokinase [Rhodoglobus sp.]|nr:2-amino-4-hydroxy-6-hydroxymethyldihydropteridine diphosphokinase [Rhodoglobus sp.]
MERIAVLSLGSNLGDREATLRAAVHDIGALDGVEVMRASDIVETPALAPDGVDEDAPAYLNAVILVATAHEPHDLLTALNEIEAAHGRVRDVRWGDRTLDIDIVNFNGLQLEEEGLTLPHPRAADRAFVLEPWLQLDADAVLPGHGRVDALLASTTDSVNRYPSEPLK